MVYPRCPECTCVAGECECSSKPTQNKRIAPQPAPKDTGSRPTWELVIEDVKRWFSPAPLLVADMKARDAQGRAKYGVPLTADNGRDHLLDSYQELLDGAVYLRAELESGSNLVWPIYRDVLRTASQLRDIISQRDASQLRGIISRRDELTGAK